MSNGAEKVPSLAPIGKFAFYISLTVGIFTIISFIVGAAVRVTSNVYKVEIKLSEKIDLQIKQLDKQIDLLNGDLTSQIKPIDKNLRQLIAVYRAERRILKALVKHNENLGDLLPEKLDIH